MDFTFARATRGRAVFPVFASPDERVRRDQRDAARLSRPLLAFRLFPQWLTRGVSTADLYMGEYWRISMYLF
jgi:hypothetical protein